MNIITLGIGPGSNIKSLVLTGLEPSSVVIFSGLRPTTIKRTIAGLDFDRREMYISDTALLEDGSGYLLFEDGTRVAWDILTGNESLIKRDISGRVQ